VHRGPGAARLGALHRRAAPLLCRGAHRVSRHRPGSHTAVPRAAGKPGPAPGHAFAVHRGRVRRRRGGQPQAPGRAGRGGGRAGAPFRAGHRRGLPGCAGLLAASGHLLDGELPLVLGNDHRVHGGPAGADGRRPPNCAHPGLPCATPVWLAHAPASCHAGGGAAGVRRIWFFRTRSRRCSASCGSMGRMWAAHHRAASGSGEGSQNSGPA
jgi:hypothetical protein